MWAMLQKSIKRYPVVTFFVLTYIFSWGLIIPAYTIFRSSLFLAWVGLFGPAIAGLVMTVYCDGKEGIKRLIKGMTKWRSNWGAYLFVFGVPFVLVAGTIFLHDGLGPLITWVGTLKKILPLSIGMAVLMLILVAGEEIGWRGFALPRLQERYGSNIASTLIGFLWGVWHIPLALDPTNVLNRGPFLISVVIFIVSTICFSFLYTWLWNYSGRSLLLICLFHSLYNTVNHIYSGIYPYIIDQHWIYVIVMLILIFGLFLSKGQNNWWVSGKDAQKNYQPSINM